jgi:hypothetical protein
MTSRFEWPHSGHVSTDSRITSDMGSPLTAHGLNMIPTIGGLA